MKSPDSRYGQLLALTFALLLFAPKLASAQADAVINWLAINGGRPVDIYERPWARDQLLASGEVYTELSQGDERTVDIYDGPGEPRQLLASGAVFAELSRIVKSGPMKQAREVEKVRMQHRAFINKRTDTQAMVVEDRDAAVVVFRGTESRRDWLLNVVGAAGLEFGVFGQVHKGFLLAAAASLSEVKAALDASLAQRPRRKVWVVGHSMGGAVAQLTAAMLRADGYPLSGVVTFGSPAVGDATWRDQYEALLGSITHRWIRGDDIVPCLPPSQSKWKQAGQQHFLPDGSLVLYDGKSRCEDFFNFANPISEVCSREPKVVRLFRRALLDPADALCSQPDPFDAIFDLVANRLSGAGGQDHDIKGYRDHLVMLLGFTGELLVP